MNDILKLELTGISSVKIYEDFIKLAQKNANSSIKIIVLSDRKFVNLYAQQVYIQEDMENPFTFDYFIPIDKVQKAIFSNTQFFSILCLKICVDEACKLFTKLQAVNQDVDAEKRISKLKSISSALEPESKMLISIKIQFKGKLEKEKIQELIKIFSGVIDIKGGVRVKSIKNVKHLLEIRKEGLGSPPKAIAKTKVVVDKNKNNQNISSSSVSTKVVVDKNISSTSASTKAVLDKNAQNISSTSATTKVVVDKNDQNFSSTSASTKVVVDKNDQNISSTSASTSSTKTENDNQPNNNVNYDSDDSVVEILISPDVNNDVKLFVLDLAKIKIDKHILSTTVEKLNNFARFYIDGNNFGLTGRTNIVEDSKESIFFSLTFPINSPNFERKLNYYPHHKKSRLTLSLSSDDAKLLKTEFKKSFKYHSGVDFSGDNLGKLTFLPSKEITRIQLKELHRRVNYFKIIRKENDNDTDNVRVKIEKPDDKTNDKVEDMDIDTVEDPLVSSLLTAAAAAAAYSPFILSGNASSCQTFNTLFNEDITLECESIHFGQYVYNFNNTVIISRRTDSKTQPQVNIYMKDFHNEKSVEILIPQNVHYFLTDFVRDQWILFFIPNLSFEELKELDNPFVREMLESASTLQGKSYMRLIFKLPIKSDSFVEKVKFLEKLRHLFNLNIHILSSLDLFALQSIRFVENNLIQSGVCF